MSTALTLYNPPTTALTLYKPPTKAIQLYNPPSTNLDIIDPVSVKKVPDTMNFIKNSVKQIENNVLNIQLSNSYYEINNVITEAKEKQEELNDSAKEGSSAFETLGNAVKAVGKGLNVFTTAFDVIKMLMPFSEEISSAVEQVQNKAVEWVLSLNQAGGPLNKIALKIQDIVKWLESPTGQRFFDALTAGAIVATTIACFLADIVLWIVSLFVDNWSFISPIIWGIAAAMLALNAKMILTGIITLGNNIISGIQNVLLWKKAAATKAATVAQQGLNTAMSMNPITLFILAIIALITVFYIVIAAINRFAGTSISATGMIAGALSVAGAFIYNLFLGLLQFLFAMIERLYNAFAAFANFFGNIFNDPIAAIINLYADFADVILGFIEKIAAGIDCVFGTKLADTVKGWRTNIELMAEAAVKQYGNGTYQDRVGKLDINKMLNNVGINLERIEYGDAYNAGYGFGESIEKKIGDMFKLNGDNSPNLDELMGTKENPIHAEVDSVNDTVDISSEDLKTMRELAEMKSIQNFVTLHPTVNVKTGDINNGYDVNTIIARIEDCLVNEIASSAQGVYN